MELKCEQSRYLIWYCFKRMLSTVEAHGELQAAFEDQAPPYDGVVISKPATRLFLTLLDMDDLRQQ